MRQRKPRGLRMQAWLVARILQVFLRFLVRRGMFDVEVIGEFPTTGAALIACNHDSLLDPVVIMGAARRNVIALAMAELWRVPGLNLLVWLLGQIPVDRKSLESGEKAIIAAQGILLFGGLILIFPEGRCRRGGKHMLPFRMGVANLAWLTRVPIIPAYIQGTAEVLPLKSRRLDRSKKITLRIGAELIDPNDFDSPQAILPELRRHIETLQHQSEN